MSRRLLVVAGIAITLAISATGNAAAPAGHFVNAAGIVTDAETKLSWEQPTDGVVRTYADAQTYCQTLALAGGGWRTPSWKELLTLVDDSTTNPAVDGAFVGTALVAYWSSTLISTSRRTVDFTFGYTSAAPGTDMHPVRCVR